MIFALAALKIYCKTSSLEQIETGLGGAEMIVDFPRLSRLDSRL